MNKKLILGIGIGFVAGVVATVVVLIVLARHSFERKPEAQPAMRQTAVPTQPPVENPVGNGMINGRPLSGDQIAALEQRYRVRPKPGHYWYDARSGLFGEVGMPAAGFMLTGHDFGPLASDASHGDTGIYLNARNITRQEWQIISALAQTPVQAGRYWMDGNGNVGYEGNDTPVGNLFAAAQAGGGKGGGDNFWTTRFSAGNYNADNSQGYVSVPGYGPVGYGF